MAELPVIRIAPNPDIRLHDFDDGISIAVVDDFLADPHNLVANVAEYAGEFVSKPVGHPCRGRDIEESAIQDLRRFIRSNLSRVFRFHRADIKLKAFLSNLALKPEELSPYHRMCHIDPRISPIHHTYAGIVYLFANPELGGTGFFRWKAKDIAVRAYELALHDIDAALEYLREHSEHYRKPPEYMTASNDIAELLAAMPAKFNRAVFYSGGIPHSAHITRPDLLTSVPTRGRLTLNLFAGVRPKDVAGGAV
ncbi:MAG: DUF6445 family protein [Gammaproteobacteria bacterium]|nr:DUF6445 family protein [Gammaproteobacteria bacterium]